MDGFIENRYSICVNQEANNQSILAPDQRAFIKESEYRYTIKYDRCVFIYTCLHNKGYGVISKRPGSQDKQSRAQYCRVCM